MRIERLRLTSIVGAKRVVMAVSMAFVLSAQPADAAGSGSPLGCLHQTAKTCMLSAAKFFSLYALPDFRQKRKTVDANGKSVDGTDFGFTGRDDDNFYVHISLYLAPDQTALEAKGQTDFMPGKGQTEYDYVDGYVYEMAGALLGDKCVGDRGAFYNFMGNSVRPRLDKGTMGTRTTADTTFTFTTRIAGNVAICNRTMNFTQISGYAKDLIPHVGKARL
jgi:hypothetical protein